MRLTAMLFLLIFGIHSCLAQNLVKNEFRGTIKVRRNLTKLQDVFIAQKMGAGLSFRFRVGNSDFRIIIPKRYNYKLTPMVAGNNSIVLVDKDKNITGSIVEDYMYELFIGNCTANKLYNRGSLWNIFSAQVLHPGSYIWVSELTFTDSEGNFHQKEIGEFKIERLN